MMDIHMLIHVDIRGSRRIEKSVEIPEGETVIHLLRSISIRPDGVVCFIDNTPVPVDSILKNGQELTVVEAASGG
jgi:sulfur carrier protein ThiS